MNTIKVIGLDLAKSVFQVHGVDGEGNTVLKKRLPRAQTVVVKVVVAST